MAHPSQYFIRYLLAASHGSDTPESEESVNKSLKSMSLLRLTSDQFNDLVLSFKPPQAFSFSNRKHPATKTFMESERIATMWSPSKEDSRVLKELMPMTPVREMINLLLMGRVPSDKIAEVVSEEARLTTPLTERMIDTYQHYYWNVEVSSSDEWEAILAGNPKKDALMASLYCGEEQAMYRIGRNPKMGDPQRPLREAYRQTFFRLQLLRYWPDTSNTVSAASKLIRDAKQLYELLYGQEGTGFEQQLKKFRQFLLVKHPAAIETFDGMLSEEGSYSGDGSEKKDQKTKKGDQDANT